MNETTLQQKQQLKEQLQHQYAKIEKVLNELMPHPHLNELSMKNDTELQVRC